MKLKTLIAIYLTVSSFIACSKQQFAQAPSPACEGSDCTQNPDGSETFRENVIVPDVNRKVDILFVVDNSGSMIQEQQRIADRFSGFLSILTYNGQPLDYRIAIATTDNESGPQVWKNGKLVRFQDGTSVSNYYWIDRNTPNKDALFYNTVRRPETIQCQWMPASLCAAQYGVSGDERGIMTALKTVRGQSTAAGFMRSDAILHVIFVSDEDERSNGGSGTRQLVADDLPATLISALGGVSATKKFQFHSIVRVPSEYTNIDYFVNGGGFQNCVDRQRAMVDSGGSAQGYEFDGCHYVQASALTGGRVGDIRNTNYTSTFNEIGSSIIDTSLAQISFRCVPRDLKVEPLAGYPYPSSLSNPFVQTNLTNNFFVFNPRLLPGSGIRVTYTCPPRGTN